MKAKNVRMQVKAEGDDGSFVATFATLNVIDKDGDVTVPGAFQDGQAVRISAWGHNWGALPVGKGVIHADDERAWVEGQFFLDTTHGKDTYLTVKALGDLQEWSYGYDITDAAPGQFDGRDVQFLRGLEVHEVSPVLIGAGVDTRTDQIKGAKEGRRTNAADREMMARMRDQLREMVGMIEEMMGDGEPKEGRSAGKAEDRASGKAEDRGPGFWAEQVALELLEAGVA